MHLGWRRSTEAPAGLNDRIVGDLRAPATAGRTGALVVTDQTSARRAWLYLFEGGLYAAAMEGFRPDVAARLRASGHSGAYGDLNANTRAGAEAVRTGVLDVEVARRVHQEFLLAEAGAILTLTKARTEFVEAETTDLVCTIPVALDDVLRAVNVRGDRLKDDLQAVADAMRAQAPGLADVGPSELVLAPTGSALPTSLALPEFGAFADHSNGRLALDDVAGSCGFTRAEAVHLARQLLTLGVLTGAGRVELHDPGRLQVPEAFPGARP